MALLLCDIAHVKPCVTYLRPNRWPSRCARNGWRLRAMAKHASPDAATNDDGQWRIPHDRDTSNTGQVMIAIDPIPCRCHLKSCVCALGSVGVGEILRTRTHTHSLSLTHTTCTPHVNACGGAGGGFAVGASVFFISYILFVTIVLVNVAVAVLLEVTPNADPEPRTLNPEPRTARLLYPCSQMTSAL